MVRMIQTGRGARRRRDALALCIAATISTSAIGGAAHAADFPSVVATILNSQTDSRVARLDPPTKQLLIDCINRVLDGLPAGKKRYILAGSNFDEQEDRFGEVVKENRAEWQQKIARACGGIALRGGIGHS